jgi:uncharacterized Zn finger protein
MQLTLNNIDEIIEHRFVERGINYWLEGAVINLKDNKSNWTANVQGTELYLVKIELEDIAVINYECSCPFDKGKVCKHIIAVLFAIKSKLKKQHNIKAQSSNNKIEISDILNEVKSFQLSKMKFDKLIFDADNIVYDIFEYYEKLTDKKIKKFNNEKAKEVLSKISLLEKQISPLINILQGIDYEEKEKYIYRLINTLEMLNDELPKVKELIEKRS